MPVDDEMCAPVSCDPLTRFALESADDGAKRCVMYSHQRAGGSCYRLGYCHSTTGTACVEAEPQELFRGYPGCTTIRGCDSTGMPSASMLSEGATCHAYGRCDADGRCSAPEQCATLALSQESSLPHTYCGAPSDSSCEVNVVARGTGAGVSNVSCDAYCAQSLMTCVGAWSINAPCVKNNSVNCSEARANIICECRKG
jgi:hypothetical protein